jgi:probable HAF family extracellular repeat protein
VTTYTYELIDPPGSTYTLADSINDKGQIVGLYQNGSGKQYGFLDSNGSYTTIVPPGSNESAAYGINAEGQIIGVYSPPQAIPAIRVSFIAMVSTLQSILRAAISPFLQASTTRGKSSGPIAILTTGMITAFFIAMATTPF